MNIKVLTDEQIIRILEENKPEYDGLDKAIAVSRAIEQAVLQSHDRDDAALAETLRESAEIIAAIQPEHAPENIRWPIVDELHGFASMIDHARRIEKEKQ